MRIDFNILWVEDQIDRVDSTRERIELMIRKDGFRLRVKFAANIEDALGFIADDIYGDHIDLILMDYDLGAGRKGDEGLLAVRHDFPFKDIVFYSAEAENLPAMVARHQVQGIFCSTRDDLHETVHGVFDNLMKKVLDIDHCRGIVMGATSDIDQCVNECLATTFNKGSDELKKVLLEVVARHVGEKEASFQAELGAVRNTSNIEEIQAYHNIYTSNDRLRLLKNVIDKSGKNQDLSKLFGKYMNDTVKLRNNLAHVQVKVDGFSRKLFNKKGEELTNAQMRQLRQDLLEMQLRMEQLHAEIHQA